MICLAIDHGLTGILRMKNGKTKYRTSFGGKVLDLTAAEIYSHVVKGNWQKVKVYGSKWQMASTTVKINLNDSNKKEKRWHKVKLLYVRGLDLDQGDRQKADKWALFLSTDAEIDSLEMLEVYAMRWSIETFFKESKQHLKWLAEQTRSYASHCASLHLSAVCYMVLLHLTLDEGYSRIGETRDELVDQIRTLSYAQKLWKMFRVMIHNALDSMNDRLGCATQEVMDVVDRQMEMFFVDALQLDSRIIQQEHCLELPPGG